MAVSDMAGRGCLADSDTTELVTSEAGPNDDVDGNAGADDMVRKSVCE